MESIADQFHKAQEVLSKFIAEPQNFQLIENAAQLMATALKNGNKIISCGNGGSMCDAMHFAEELSGRFRDNRPGLAALSISDPSHISCVSNDFGYEHVFSRYVQAIGSKGDVLLAISTSGNSKNVLNAIKEATAKGMSVVSLTGKDGGQMAKESTIEIRAPYSDYADRAQEIHIKVIHSLILRIEQLV